MSLRQGFRRALARVLTISVLAGSMVLGATPPVRALPAPGQAITPPARLIRPANPLAADQWFTLQRAAGGGSYASAYAAARQQAAALPTASRPGQQTGAGRFSPQGLTPPSSWQNLGPTQITGMVGPGNTPMGNSAGRITAIAVAGATWYIGAAGGGVWKSTNSGSSWTPLTDSMPSLAVGAIAVDPNDANTIYVGTGEAHNSVDSFYGVGLLKSSDGGATWVVQGGDTFTGAHISAIAVDPNTAGKLYVGADNGLFVSTDGGVSWQNLGVTNRVDDVKVTSSGGSSYLFAAVRGQGVYKSDGSTGHYVEGLPVGNSFGVARLAVRGSMVFVLVSDFNVGPHQYHIQGLYNSGDWGTTWGPMYTPPDVADGDFYYGPGSGEAQGWYDLAIAVNPTDPTEIWIGGVGLSGTKNSGSQWTPGYIDPGNLDVAGTLGIHPDVQTLAFDASGNLLVGTDGGLWRIDTAASPMTGEDLNGDLSITQESPGLSQFQDGDLVVVGSQDNGTIVQTGGTNQELWGGDGGFTLFDSGNQLFWVTNAGGYVTLTDGMTWAHDVTPSTSELANWIAPMVMDPNNSSKVYQGRQNVWVTSSGPNTTPDTWTKLTTQTDPSLLVTALAVAPSNSQVLYAAWFGMPAGTPTTRLWRSGDGGAHWTSLSLPTSRWITSITVDPANANTIYLTMSGVSFPQYNPSSPHVLKLTKTNTTPVTSDITGNLPNAPVNALVQHGTALIVASDVGVFTSGDGGQTWRALGSQLPNVQVVDLKLTDNGLLLAATHGRGTWYIDVGVSPANPTVVSGISPNTGSAAGGDTVTITGANFTSVTAVNFGPVPAASYTVDSPTQITAVAPAGTPGTVDVIVTAAGGKSATSASTKYTYVVGPVLNAISPASAAAGSSITLTGTGFTNMQGTVRFTQGSTTTTGAVMGTWTNTSITVQVPAGLTGGPVSVQVCTSGMVCGNSRLMNITAADGVVDSLIWFPRAMYAGLAQAEIGFQFTVPQGGWANGELQFDVPAGWIAPQVTSLSTQGNVWSNTGFVNVSGRTVKVTGVNLTSNESLLVFLESYEDALVTHSGTYTVPVRAKATATGTVTDAAPASTTIPAGTANALEAAIYPLTLAGEPDKLTVTTYDATGEPDSGFRGTLHFTSSDPQAVLPADYTFVSGDNGLHIFPVTFKTPGNQTVTVTSGGRTGITGSVDVQPGLPATLQLTQLPPTQAGVPATVTVTALDAYGNVVTWYWGSIHFSSSDSDAVMPSVLVLPGSTTSFPIIFRTGGTQTYTVTDVLNPSLTASKSVSVAPTTLTIKLTSSGTPITSVTAGQAADLTVTAKDANGMVVTGYGDTVTVTSTDPAAPMPDTAHTFTPTDSGQHTFHVTLKTAGQQTITVSAGSITFAVNVMVTPAAVDHLAVSAPSNATVGVPVTVTVTAKDQYGNTITDYTGAVHFTASGPAAPLPADYTFKLADNGTHAFTVTFNSAGGATVTATDKANNAVTGTTAAIQVSAPPVSGGGGGGGGGSGGGTPPTTGTDSDATVHVKSSDDQVTATVTGSQGVDMSAGDVASLKMDAGTIPTDSTPSGGGSTGSGSTQQFQVKLVVVPVAQLPGLGSAGGGTSGGTATTPPAAPPTVLKPQAAIEITATFSAPQSGSQQVHQLAKPVSISFNVPPETLAQAQQVIVAYFDTALGMWVQLPTTVDPVTGKVTATVSHFTQFAVFTASDSTSSVGKLPTGTVKSDLVNISGTGGAGSVITVYDNGDVIGSLALTGKSNWVMPVRLKPGVNNLTVAARESGGTLGLGESTVLYDAPEPPPAPPQPPVVPTNPNELTKTIDTTAGAVTVSSDDGLIRLVFPTRSLPAGATVTLTRGTDPGTLPAGLTLASPVWTVATSATLTAPVTATLRYAVPVGATAAQLGLYTRVNGEWQYYRGITGLNDSNWTITASMRQSGTWAVLATTARFIDLTPGHWAYASAMRLMNAGIMRGLPDGSFQPDRPITRAEFVHGLLATLGIHPDPPFISPFVDVPLNAWYAADFAFAFQKQLLLGSDGKARPDAPISRQEAATLLLRALFLGGAAGLPTMPAQLPTFADQAKIDAWAQDAASKMSLYGLMTGYPDGTFGPARTLTRAETAVILSRLLERVASQPAPLPR